MRTQKTRGPYSVRNKGSWLYCGYFNLKAPNVTGGRGLSMEGNLRFKIDWASLIVRRKFTIFALFYLCIWGKFPSKSPPGPYIWRGDLTEGFLRYEFGGLIFGGAYFRFYGTFTDRVSVLVVFMSFLFWLRTGMYIDLFQNGAFLIYSFIRMIVSLSDLVWK